MNNKTILNDLYYTFDPSNKRIIFNTIYIKKESILLITNLTDNKIIYNFACSTEGGTLESNILTLIYNTSTMSSSDKLMIIVTEEDKKEEYLLQILEEQKEINEKLKTLENLNSEESIVGNFILDEFFNKKKNNTYYKHITTATTTIIKIGEGFFNKIIVNNPSNDSITIYDNYTDSGNIITIIDPGLSTVVPFFLPYEVNFKKGLTVVTAGVADITIIFE